MDFILILIKFPNIRIYQPLRREGIQHLRCHYQALRGEGGMIVCFLVNCELAQNKCTILLYSFLIMQLNHYLNFSILDLLYHS